jgi:hypothetical protein
MDGNIEAPIVAAAPTHEHAQEHAGAPISRIVAEVAARFPGERISLGDMALNNLTESQRKENST